MGQFVYVVNATKCIFLKEIIIIVEVIEMWTPHYRKKQRKLSAIKLRGRAKTGCDKQSLTSLPVNLPVISTGTELQER